MTELTFLSPDIAIIGQGSTKKVIKLWIPISMVVISKWAPQH